MSEEPRPRFEGVIEELERLVLALESGELPLEDALKLYERGVTLTRQGNELLEGAERRVEELRRTLSGGPSL